MTNAVEIDGVTKLFKHIKAVDELSLIVPENTIYGFIGPNGSGKTTTLRMIMRIFAPDIGQIQVLGQNNLLAANDQVAYLPEERGLYKKMKVQELLSFYGELKGFRNAQTEINHWLERMRLKEWANLKIESLSKGMAQKVQFIATVLAHPRLVLLDEPFSGLDPINADVMRDAIIQLKKEGTTIIFSTHDMSMAERMCDFIFMIFQGRKVLDGTLESIRNLYGNDTIRIQLENSQVSWDALPGVAKITDFGQFQELRLQERADENALLHELMRRGTIRLYEKTRPSLNDIFIRIAQPQSTTEPGSAQPGYTSSP